MYSRGSTLLRAAIAAALIAGSNGAGLACGNELIYGVLFSKFPLAELAHRSESTARRGGLYEAPVYKLKSGQSYHQWSVGRAKAIFARFHDRLRAYAEETGEELTIAIMLADEVSIAFLTSGSAAPRIESAFNGLRDVPRIDVYTTVNALGALDDGGLDWLLARERGLVVLRDPNGRGRLNTVFDHLYGAP